MHDIGLIRDYGEAERPRERLEKMGVEALRDAELLAIILRTGYRGHGALEWRKPCCQHPLAELLSLPLPRLKALRGWVSAGQPRWLPRRNFYAASRKISEPITRSSIQRMNHRPSGRAAFQEKGAFDGLLPERPSANDRQRDHFHRHAHRVARPPREIFAPAIGKAAAESSWCTTIPPGIRLPVKKRPAHQKDLASGHIWG